MYLISVVLLLLAFPAASVAVASVMHSDLGLWALTGQWFTFWAVGVRLFVAGLRQTLQPRFTAETIFAIKDRSADPIVRELGFANLAMGTLGLCSLAREGWLAPAALAGGLYYGLAAIGHAVRPGKNRHEQVALISDTLMFLLLASFAASRLA